MIQLESDAQNNINLHNESVTKETYENIRSRYSLHALLSLKDISIKHVIAINDDLELFYDNLDNFLEKSGELIPLLNQPSFIRNPKHVITAIMDIRSLLVAIGSTTLVYEIVKLETAIKNRDSYLRNELMEDISKNINAILPKVEECRLLDIKQIRQIKSEIQLAEKAKREQEELLAQNEKLKAAQETREKEEQDKSALEQSAQPEAVEKKSFLSKKKKQEASISKDISTEAASETKAGADSAADATKSAAEIEEIKRAARRLKKKASKEETEQEATPRTIYKISDAVRSELQQSKANILIVDDMPDTLAQVTEMLKNYYNVYGLTGGEAVTKFLRLHSIDFFLLDIEMPGIDGYTLLTLIKQIPQYKDTPIMFLTSNATIEYLKTAKDLGAAGFIKKPVDAEVLQSKVRQFVRL